MSLSNSAVIFIEGNIENPMEAILNTPVRPDNLIMLRSIRTQATDIEAIFLSRFIPQLTGTANPEVMKHKNKLKEKA
jgi:hypothetical protein